MTFWELSKGHLSGTTQNRHYLEVSGASIGEIKDSRPLRFPWAWGADPIYGGQDDSGKFEHGANRLTIEVVASGFPTTSTHDWQISHLQVATYIPKIGLTGGGTAIEDGSGDATFTAVRDGSPANWAKPLTVMLHSTGGTAIEGKDYQPINSITIPAGQQTGTVTVNAINDDAAEGLLDLYQSVTANQNYVLGWQNTGTTVGPTTAKAGKDDDVHIKELDVLVDGNNARSNSTSGYEFHVEFYAVGEGLDRADLKQDLITSTSVENWNGTAETVQDIQNEYSGARPEVLNSNGKKTDWDYIPFSVTPNTHNGRAVIEGVREDNHVFTVASKPATWNNTAITISKLAKVTFDGYDTIRDRHSNAAKYTSQWSYEWDNYAAVWNGNAPPPPETACVRSNSVKPQFVPYNVFGLDGLN